MVCQAGCDRREEAAAFCHQAEFWPLLPQQAGIPVLPRGRQAWRELGLPLGKVSLRQPHYAEHCGSLPLNSQGVEGAL
jgi:hypothetical protein